MAIELTQPITQPAKTFDSVWITFSEIRSPKPNGKTLIRSVAAPLNTKTGELGATKIEIVVGDVFTEAATRAAQGKTKLAQWLQLGMEVFQEMAAEQGKI